jgi:small subunit ribosomal protein S6
MLLLDPELSDERAAAIIQRIQDSVADAQGSWDGHEPWGRRRLAFEIDHKGEAVYHLLLFSAPAETLAEIVRVLKITDGVIRHGAFRRVKGGHTKAPAQIPAATPAYASSTSSDEPEAVTAAEPVAATDDEPVAVIAEVPAAVSATGDDSVETAE